MPFNNSITSIRNYFNGKKGLQRSNRFNVVFKNTPVALPYSDILAEEFVLQPRAIEHTADNLTGYGIGRLIPRKQTFYNGFNLVFPVPGDNKIIKFFDSWFNKLYRNTTIGGVGNFKLDYYDDTVKNCQCEVELLDLNGARASRYTFYEVYPTEILPITMSSQPQNQYLKLAITFNFREYAYT